MRNVNTCKREFEADDIEGFILTMRNVNTVRVLWDIADYLVLY